MGRKGDVPRVVAEHRALVVSQRTQYKPRQTPAAASAAELHAVCPSLVLAFPGESDASKSSFDYCGARLR